MYFFSHVLIVNITLIFFREIRKGRKCGEKRKKRRKEKREREGRRERGKERGKERLILL